MKVVCIMIKKSENELKIDWLDDKTEYHIFGSTFKLEFLIWRRGRITH